MEFLVSDFLQVFGFLQNTAFRYFFSVLVSFRLQVATIVIRWATSSAIICSPVLVATYSANRRLLRASGPTVLTSLGHSRQVCIFRSLIDSANIWRDFAAGVWEKIHKTKLLKLIKPCCYNFWCTERLSAMWLTAWQSFLLGLYSNWKYFAPV